MASDVLYGGRVLRDPHKPRAVLDRMGALCSSASLQRLAVHDSAAPSAVKAPAPRAAAHQPQWVPVVYDGPLEPGWTHVLHIEDEAVQRRAMQHKLARTSSHPHVKLLSAATATDGMRMLRNTAAAAAEACVLACIDLRLEEPRMSGMDFAVRVRQEMGAWEGRVVLIACTASLDELVNLQARGLFDGVLFKPFTSDDLRHALEAHARHPQRWTDNLHDDARGAPPPSPHGSSHNDTAGCITDDGGMTPVSTTTVPASLSGRQSSGGGGGGGSGGGSGGGGGGGRHGTADMSYDVVGEPGGCRCAPPVSQ
jgi:CheY-like chemotaxis protein